MFDTICTLILATIIIIIFQATASYHFHGLGFFVSRDWILGLLRANIGCQWLVIVLYGITGALFAYCVSLMVASPLAAFAAVAGYQIVMFIVCYFMMLRYTTNLSIAVPCWLSSYADI
jgi:hypothetical protein